MNCKIRLMIAVIKPAKSILIPEKIIFSLETLPKNTPNKKSMEKIKTIDAIAAYVVGITPI